MDAGTWVALAGVVVSLGVSIWALLQSAQANRIAKRADDRSDRDERRSLEHNDVTWQPGWTDRKLTATNVGRDPAYEVTAVVTVDGVRHVREADVLREGESLEVDLADQAAAALEAYNVAARRAASSYAYYAGGASLTVSERIHWRTEGGTWSNHHGDEHELDL
jgi:hypothetical protein